MAQESYSSKYRHRGRGGSDPSYGRLCCSNRAFGLDCLDTLCDHLHVDTSPFLGAGNCPYEGLSKCGRSHVTCCARLGLFGGKAEIKLPGACINGPARIWSLSFWLS